MKFEITLRMATPDGEWRESEVIVLAKGHDRHEDTGLSIEEGKALPKALQQKIVEAQAEAFCASKSMCQGCGRRLRKGGPTPSATAPSLVTFPSTALGITAVAARAVVPRPSAPWPNCFRTTRRRSCCGWKPGGPPWCRSGARSIFSRMFCPSARG